MTIILLVVKIFAFVNSLMFSAESYVAAGKLTKPVWALILGLGVALQVLLIDASPINLIGLGLHDRSARLSCRCPSRSRFPDAPLTGALRLS